MPYSEWLGKLVPRPFRGPNGMKLWRAIGRRIDVINQLVRAAVLARFPMRGSAEDSLAQIGLERRMPRGDSEVPDDYADRLRDAWTAWGPDDTPVTGEGGGFGTPLGLLNALKHAGLDTEVKILYQNERYAQLDVDGNLQFGTLMDCVNRMDLTGAINPRPGWMFDGRPNFWSVFGLLFPSGELTEEQVARMNAAVALWKPANMLYVGAWVIGPASYTLGWPTGRTLGTDTALGGNVVTFHPPADGDDKRIRYTDAFATP
jgi:hypothetical protein